MQEKTMEQKHSRNNTGAKTLQKHYWSKNTPETLTDLNLPPQTKRSECSPSEKKTSAARIFQKFQGKMGEVIAWIVYLPIGPHIGPHAKRISPAKSLSLACVAILLTASLANRLRPLISTTSFFCSATFNFDHFATCYRISLTSVFSSSCRHKNRSCWNNRKRLKEIRLISLRFLILQVVRG